MTLTDLRRSAATRSDAVVRRGRWIASAAATFLLPWCLLIGAALPASSRAEHWNLAWAGLDAAEALAALTTAGLLRRRDARARLTATAGATLLLADAWFDVCTSTPGLDHALAIACAAVGELPLAAAALWFAFSSAWSQP